MGQHIKMKFKLYYYSTLFVGYFKIVTGFPVRLRNIANESSVNDIIIVYFSGQKMHA